MLHYYSVRRTSQAGSNFFADRNLAGRRREMLGRKREGTDCSVKAV
jgi:hypothetical protein